MRIKLDIGIYWDTTKDIQTEQVNEWISTNILQKLGTDDLTEGFIKPEFDEYKRPAKWVYKADDFIIEVTREYIAPLKWAKKCDIIKVKTND